MIISHSNKFIYFKPAKVAGSSVEVLLKSYCNDNLDITTGSINGWSHWEEIKKNNEYYNHMPVIDIKNKLDNISQWKNYIKIGCVRNPWDRVISFWFWKTQIAPRGWEKYKSFSFNDWVATLNKDNIYNINIKPFHYFYRWDIEKIDSLIKFETLEQDIREVLFRLNVHSQGCCSNKHYTLRTLNQTTHEHHNEKHNFWMPLY
jgi:hypothetical protein